MNRKKKIIISLGMSLILLVIINYTNSIISKGNYIEVPVSISNLNKGQKVTNQNIKWIKIKSDAETEKIYKDSVSIGILKEECFAESAINIGQLITKNIITTKDEIMETEVGFEYIAIPITGPSYSTCYQIKKGDNVTIYYTAKTKIVGRVLGNKRKLYSNSNSEGMVTCRLLENIEVISIHNGMGTESNSKSITDFIVRLKSDDAMLIANLKGQGTFDVVIN